MDDEKKLIEAKQLGFSSPFSLQFSLFYYFTKGFGLRGRQGHRQMKFGDIEIKATVNNDEYLELKERNSKIMDGTKINDYRSTRQKIFAIKNSDFCPVKLFRLFRDKRPIESLSPDSPFFLTPIKKYTQEDPTWYFNTPLGKNSLGQLMKKACVNAGIPGKKTNHSLRKSTVAELTEAGVPATKIIKITGHKNVSSLQHYDGPLKDNEHQKISKIICGSIENTVFTSPEITTASDTTSTTTTTTTLTGKTIHVKDTLTSLFSNCIFNNCEFKIYTHHS